LFMSANVRPVAVPIPTRIKNAIVV
jgi:hypothetical protein